MTRKKIVHLSSVHRALDTRIFLKECRTLAAAGYDVVLIANHDRDETRDGVRIRALPPSKTRFLRMLATPWRVLRMALSERPDLCHIHDPELVPIGMALAALGKRVVYDVHEDVPKQMMQKPYLPRWSRKPVARAVAALEAIGVRFFRGVIGVVPSISARFPSHKTETVQNFPLLGELDAPDAERPAERTNAIAYVGLLSPERGALQIVEALSLVRSDLNVRLIFVGTFDLPSTEAATRATPGWDRVDFRGFQGRREVAAALAEARAGLTLFLPLPNHVAAQPNKLFEYMAAGLPLIASDFPLWRAIVAGANCGLLVEPLDPRAIAAAIEQILEHPDDADKMGRRGREAVYARYNWNVEAEKLLRFYEACLC